MCIIKEYWFIGGMTYNIVLCLFRDMSKTVSDVSRLVWQRVTAVIKETLKTLNSKFIVGGIFYLEKAFRLFKS